MAFFSFKKNQLMLQHSTNYQNTFIQIAEDCPTAKGQTPPEKLDKKSIAQMQFEMLNNNPYKYTCDELLFQIHATRNELIESEFEFERTKFFSKGQACFRASPLTKRYGFGVHFNEEHKMALYGAETVEYLNFSSDNQIKQLKAMRSKKL